jgi:excisionase family DNA binding protein
LPAIEILTVPEIAKELRVSETQIYRLIKDGRLKKIPMGARRYVVTREHLDEFLATGGLEDPDELEARAARIRAAQSRLAAG